MPEASIVLKAYDEISGTLKSIDGNSAALNKEFELQQRKLQQLGERYKVFNRRAGEIAAEAMETKKAMDAASKAFKRSGDEADKAKFTKLRREYRELTDAAKAYDEVAAKTRKAMRETADVSKKTGGGLGSGEGAAGLLSSLGKAGMLQLAGDIAGQWAGALAGSTFGDKGGAFFGGALNGAGSGAAIGSMVAPGVGTAVGALLGAGIGAIGAGAQGYEKEDEAFKAYYTSLYKTAAQSHEADLESGKKLAARRESDRVAFATALGGEAEADRFLKQVLDTANVTPFLYDDLTKISQTLLSFGTAEKDIIPTLLKVGDGGAAKGLATGDIATVATYLGRMKSINKATMEFLNPLSERGFAVFDWLADDLGISKSKTTEEISKGKISGEYANKVILERFERLYAGQMERQSRTTEGLDSTLQGLMENINAAGGAQYNDLRNEGKERSIEAYGGELGNALSKLSAISGENKAYMENLGDRFTQEALSAVLLGQKTTLFSKEDAAKLDAMRQEFFKASNQYQSSKDLTGVGDRDSAMKMENLKEQAEALATAAYESSSMYQNSIDAELDQIEAIRENTRGLEAATNAYRISNEQTKGRGLAGMFYGLGNGNSFGGPMSASPSRRENRPSHRSGRRPRSHASGLARVPYDNYPALLHEGEKVLTAAQARSERGGNVTITGNTFVVRQESDINAIGAALAREIRARRMADGR